MDPDLDLGDTEPRALPAALARFSRPLAPGAVRRVLLPHPDLVARPRLIDVLVGAGLDLRRRQAVQPSRLERVWTLPDTVGPDMRLLISGLNPSPAAADDGVGFARPGNRFWPAALAAGLVERDRDPDHALAAHLGLVLHAAHRQDWSTWDRQLTQARTLVPRVPSRSAVWADIARCQALAADWARRAGDVLRADEVAAIAPGALDQTPPPL